MNFLIAGLGGGIGAMLRYAVSCLPFKGTFPVLTLVTNFTGAVLIGLIVGLTARKNLSGNAVLFLKTGICGGYTTFSTFSLEAYQLLLSGRAAMVAAYALLSVIGCVVGVGLGLLLSKLA